MDRERSLKAFLAAMTDPTTPPSLLDELRLATQDAQNTAGYLGVAGCHEGDQGLVSAF